MSERNKDFPCNKQLLAKQEEKQEERGSCQPLCENEKYRKPKFRI